MLFFIKIQKVTYKGAVLCILLPFDSSSALVFYTCFELPLLLAMQIIQDSATGRLYLWVSCEGPIPFPMNVPGIACLKILYADFLGLMALSNSVHPTCMFKHIGVANVLVHLAKPQLHCMYTHFRLGFLIQNICKCGFAKCLLHS